MNIALSETFSDGHYKAVRQELQRLIERYGTVSIDAVSELVDDLLVQAAEELARDGRASFHDNLLRSRTS